MIVRCSQCSKPASAHRCKRHTRLREFLPPIPRESIVSLGDGNVPLYASEASARYGGVGKLALLHLGMNPTGSFMDLGMTLAIPGLDDAATSVAARLRACFENAGLHAESYELRFASRGATVRG